MGTTRDEREAADRMSLALHKAVEAHGKSERALQWLSEANAALHGEKPADVATASEEGLQRVLKILGRIDGVVYD